ncbi:MAG: DUF6691 family protein [Sneathiella sp.]
MFKFIATIAGVLFGYGLALSGMLSPSKIVGFLDVTGNWDPSLAFVMGGAVMVTFVSFKILLKRPLPIFGDRFHLPKASDIDRRLLIGAGLFGIGWGIGGFCPGPVISSLAYASPKVVVFVFAMLVGMFLAKRFSSKSAP